MTENKDAAQTGPAQLDIAASGMTKILSLMIVGLMIVQIIKPLGLPGLRRRSDFWKLAIIAMAMIGLTATLSHGN